MKNNKSDEIQINISVIGLSGSENVKGISGVGKSCLCNRLAQPSFYKHKHVSTISSIDFYGSTFNQSHWLYWSHIKKEIRGKKYKFHFIEQTVFLDDSSFREFKTNSEPQDFVKRASMTELRVNKKAYKCNMRSLDGSENVLPNTDEKLHIHLFLLVFDVSEVDRRNPRHQEAIFKQLFDSAIASKKPIIVATTKNDAMSVTVADKLRAIIEKRPYSKYPVVETSAKLDINIGQIYELAAGLCDPGTRIGSLRQAQVVSYADAVVTRDRDNEEHRQRFLRSVEQTLVGDDAFMSWDEFSSRLDERLAAVGGPVAIGVCRQRLSGHNLAALFADKQREMLLTRRAANNRRFKELLQALLAEFDHLIPLDDRPIEEIIKNLKSESAFISHFIEFDRGLEHFPLERIHSSVKRLPVLPACLLDTAYENNLLFLIEEFALQKSLEHRLYNHLVEHCHKYQHKSMMEMREDLTRFVKHFIRDKVVNNVYHRFRDYCLSTLRCKFLDAIQENSDVIWSQATSKLIDIVHHSPWTINGLTAIVTSNLNKTSTDRKSEDISLSHKMIKEINKLIVFDELPMAQDDNNIREELIREYLAFLSSKDIRGCIVQDVTNSPCTVSVLNHVLSNKFSHTKVEERLANYHMFYVTILGNEISRTHFRDALLSHSRNLPLKICKIHSSKYAIEIVLDAKMLKDVIMDLSATDDRCSILSAVVIGDEIHDIECLVNELEQFLTYVPDTDVLFNKYIACNVDYLSNQFIDLVERLKYTIIPYYPENPHKTVDCIVTSAQKSSEQNIIWVVSVCGDKYDHEQVISFLIESVRSCSQPLHRNTSGITFVRSSNEIIIQNYRLVFVPYHQVMKLMFQSSCAQTVDAMIFLCSLSRGASINTCLAIRKYLPLDIVLSCRFLLLCIGSETYPHNEQVSNKCLRYGMEYGFYDTKATDDDSNEELKSKLSHFYDGILSNTGTLESFNSIPSTSSSLMNSNKTNDNMFRYLNKTMCQTCSDSYRSDINVYSNCSLTKVHNEYIFDSGSYDQALGDANQNVFNTLTPEFVFDGALDACTKCTEVKCTVHWRPELQNSAVKSFRTRIRSQSGPDLRIPTDLTLNTSNKFDSIFYCSICGQDLNKAQLSPSNRQSFRSMRQSGTKESSQKTFTAKLHDLFSPIKKLSETQSTDIRKSSIRNSSKRPK